MAKGLFKNWKQQIFNSFDKKMTREFLMNMKIQLGEKKINVAGIWIVSGNSINNISHWKELDAHDYTKPYFEHPITKQKTKKNKIM